MGASFTDPQLAGSQPGPGGCATVRTKERRPPSRDAAWIGMFSLSTETSTTPAAPELPRTDDRRQTTGIQA